jgi:hypothetical protein
MRTWLVLAAVLAVAAAAVADALHGHLGKASPPRPPQVTPASRIVPPGVPAGFMGTVYYSDAGDGCRLKALELPGFADAVPPAFRGCRFSLSPDGRAVRPAGAVWSPQGGLVAIPRGETFELESPASSQTLRVTGKAPAFKPDGTLTFLLDGRLVEWTNRCHAGERLFTLPGDNATARCVRTLLRDPLQSVAWLTDTRFLAILADGTLGIFDGRRMVIRQRLPPTIARVEPSPRRTFYTLWLDGKLAGGFDRTGTQIALPPITDVRALAWAPTERWGVLATGRGSVYLFRPDTGDARLRRLTVSGRDLAWR